MILLRGGSRANLKKGQLVVGALKNVKKLVTRVRCIQQFLTIAALSDLIFRLNIRCSAIVAPTLLEYSEKGAYLNSFSLLRNLIFFGWGGAVWAEHLPLLV